MDERKRILKLVEAGTISAEEAIELLEALSQQKEPTQSTAPSVYTTPEQTTTNKEPEFVFEEEKKRKTTGFEDLFSKLGNKDLNRKVDELMQELRHDLSEFSGRMMTMMNTTLSKVKDFDVEFPFGEKVEFSKSYAFNADEVRGFEIDIPNGRVTVERGSAEPNVLIEALVKTQKKETEYDTIEEFTDGFVELKDGKIEVATQSKLSHVALNIVLPEKQYDVFIIRLLNGGITVNDAEAKLLKVKTYNGTVKAENVVFDHANLQSANGAIEARGIQGDDIEAETANGRIYIDGDVKEVEAESVNGHVVVTTTSNKAYKVKARTVAGSVELYIPKDVALDGQVTSNLGRTDVGLTDVAIRTGEGQFLQKTCYFNKMIEDAPMLKLVGESRTGSIVVRYTTQGE
ncbi:DUF4097 family beta strand repeat-containing protein [Lysinibacillus sp. 3P01SB]|uniref:DUF4097 family beta strand repeat-containing protein n=1 Tax=Lysinibacillus sp. 3P01SB TaxID=3132284 RepID=UPI0039A6B595